MVLFFALIALVVMSLAAVALIRSVDTSTMIAGNLAFKQSATTSGDSGVEGAITALTADQAAMKAANNNVLSNTTNTFNVDQCGKWILFQCQSHSESDRPRQLGQCQQRARRDRRQRQRSPLHHPAHVPYAMPNPRSDSYHQNSLPVQRGRARQQRTASPSPFGYLPGSGLSRGRPVPGVPHHQQNSRTR